jgi:hypothetical protein
VSDDKGDIDGSDWLASQFDPTEEVPKQAPPPAVPTQRLPVQPQPAQPQPVQPQAPVAPQPNPAGGFNWGLRPGGGAEPVSPPAPVPVTPEQSAPPTEAPPAPRAMPREPLPPTEPFVLVQPGSLLPPAVTPPASTAPAAPPPLVSPPLVSPTAPATPEVDPGPPTQAMPTPSWDSLDGVDEPTAAFTVPPWEPATASAAPPAAPQQPAAPQPTVAFDASAVEQPRDPTSAIDSLFGDNQFQEYEDLGVLQTITPPPSAPAGPETHAPAPVVERAPITKTQRTLMIVAGALVALIALVALFFLGQRLGQQSAEQPVGAPSGSASAPAQAPSNGLAAPGVQSFSALQGGECLQPFTSAWSATYTVVDCGSSHVGQLVFKGTLPDAGSTPYPTGAQFKTEITPLCTSTSAIDYSVAKSVSDLQISFSYPSSSKDWDAGDRTYYCFVNRASGDPLPANLAVTK